MDQSSPGKLGASRLVLLMMLLPVLAFGVSACGSLAPNFGKKLTQEKHNGSILNSTALAAAEGNTRALEANKKSRKSDVLLAQKKRSAANFSKTRSKKPNNNGASSMAHSNNIQNIDRMPAWMSKTPPVVGSPQWKREQDESNRREREIQKEIEGICRGC